MKRLPVKCITLVLVALLSSASAEPGMCLVACRGNQNGNYIDGDLRRIDFDGSEVIRVTGVIGFGRNARFSPNGRQFASVQWDARTVTIATVEGAGVRTFQVEEPGVLSWTDYGIWIGSHGKITKYDTLGTKLSGREFEWCNRAFVSRNERLAAGVWESGWFGVIYDFATGNSNRLEGWEQILNCSVCPNPSGTMVTNNLYPKDSPNEQHTAMRLCDPQGNTLEKLHLREITGLPEGFYWNTQCWSGNSDDWILLPVGEKNGAFPVNNKNTSPWIYNRIERKAYRLAHRTDDFWQPYDFYAGTFPSYDTPSLQLSKRSLSFSAISGRNPTGQTLFATTPFGELEGIQVGKAPAWLDVKISGDADRFELQNFPKLKSHGAGVYIDTVVVTTENGGEGRYEVLLEISAIDSSSVRIVEELKLSPEAATVTAGSEMSFQASAFDEYGNRLGIASCAWSVSGPGTISNTGVFRACTSYGGPFVVSVAAFRGEQTVRDTAEIVVSNVSSGHLRINCGPNHYTPANWENDDRYLTAGVDRSETSPLTTHGIPGAGPSVVYRGITSGNPHTYMIPGLSPGNYTIRMHFVDLSGTQKRYMNYSIGGTNVLRDFDIHEYTHSYTTPAVFDFVHRVQDSDTLIIDCSAQTGDVFEAGMEVIAHELRPFTLYISERRPEYRSGDTIPIRWCADTSKISNITLEFSPNGGLTWSKITQASGISIDSSSWGAVDWVLPDSVTIGGSMISTVSANALVRISAYFLTGVYAVVRDPLTITNKSAIRWSTGQDKNRIPLTVRCGAGICAEARGAESVSLYRFNGAIIDRAKADNQNRLCLYLPNLPSGVYLIVAEMKSRRFLRIVTLQ